MKAIIFAAGLGTRLKPLTNNCPKALVKLNGQPLLWHTINKLTLAGVSEIVINVHHLGDQIIDYLNHQQFKVPIHISDERNLLLDTGGGLKKAQQFLTGDAPIVAYNVDIISSVSLPDVIAWHNMKKALATLVVRNRQTSRYLLFDPNMQLTGWQNKTTGETKTVSKQFENSCPFAFSGIQIISPAIFNLITEQGKFPITELYLRLAQKQLIMGYSDMSDFWIDLGKPGQIEIAENYLQFDA